MSSSESSREASSSTSAGTGGGAADLGGQAEGAGPAAEAAGAAGQEGVAAAGGVGGQDAPAAGVGGQAAPNGGEVGVEAGQDGAGVPVLAATGHAGALGVAGFGVGAPGLGGHEAAGNTASAGAEGEEGLGAGRLGAGREVRSITISSSSSLDVEDAGRSLEIPKLRSSRSAGLIIGRGGGGFSGKVLAPIGPRFLPCSWLSIAWVPAWCGSAAKIILQTAIAFSSRPSSA
jgi:hypothetical protein